MNPRIELIAELYRINTDLFHKALKVAAATDYHERPDERGNSFLWVVGHMTAYRFFTAQLLGIEDKFAHADLFKYGSEPADPSVYPQLEALGKDWDDITPKLLSCLTEVTEEELAKETPFDIPGVQKTVAALVCFMQLHESYHLGQLAYINRLHGGDRLMG